MTQYLLSVYMIDGQEPPSEDEIDEDVRGRRRGQRGDQAGGRVGVRRRPPPGRRPRRSCARTTGEVLLTDGPFAETKEQLGGFWIIEAADLDAALAWARKATVACRAPVEVRPFQDEPEQ